MSEHDDDVVFLLQRQHQQIRELLDEVLVTGGDDRRKAFEQVVRLLSVHEAAEEEVIHPYARQAVEGGEQVVADRLEEEKAGKEALKRLEKAGTESQDFLREFAALRADVLAHAEAEEKYEFARFRQNSDPEKLRTLAEAVRAAETFAPTRPHPGIESARENAVAGPAAAIVDRTRDAVRTVLGKN
jgi:hemerythrin superfamily protein